MSARGGRIRSVKRPSQRLAPTEDEFEPCWVLIRQALVDIHNKDTGKHSFEQLYRASYKIVLRKRGGELYERVRAFEEEWFGQNVMPAITELISNNLVSISLVQTQGSSANERRQMGEKFLRGIRDSWEDHNRSMNMITDILMYLDRSWSTDTKKPSIFAATIGLFRDHILRNSVMGTLGEDSSLLASGQIDENFRIFDIVNSVVLDLINMERDGDVIDRNMVKKVVQMLEDIYETDDELENQRLYLTEFEPRFLQASQVFYQKECQKLLRQTDAGSWLRHTQRRLQEENDRCNTTTSMFTVDKIAKVVDKELILAHLDEFLAMEGSGLKAMVDNDRIEDLTILYQLISRVDRQKKALERGLQVWVRELGFEIEKVSKSTDFSAAAAGAGPAGAEAEEAAADGAEKAKTAALTGPALQTAAAIKWVDDVLRLKDKFDKLWVACFNRDLDLQSAINKSFSEFINAFNRGSEYVSLFIDDNLKRGIKGKTEAEIDDILDKAIVLVRFLTDRDMFERYYQKHLARRLLHGKSESQDVENAMISRMKQEAGNHFTSKFEGMFKDMELSRDLSESYKNHVRDLGQNDAKPIELGINVLTTNNWPPEVMGRKDQGDKEELPCIYPPEIKRLQDSFFSFYLKDRSGRILTWVPSAGSADVKCVFPKIPGKESGALSRERRYELSVNTYGMIILMLFNDLGEGESLSLPEIRERTNIPVPDLVRTLASLTVPLKSRMLKKDPMSKNVKPDDRFSFNAEFVSKTVKIKAPTVNSTSKVEADDDRKETEKKNDQTRAHVVDAAVVRIMKSRKRLSHNELTTEVITQLAGRFKPEVALIKKRIEDLLAREYLERMDDPSMYQYLA